MTASGPEHEEPPRRDFGGSAHVEGADLYDPLYRSAFGIDLNYWRLGLGSDLSFFLESSCPAASTTAACTGRDPCSPLATVGVMLNRFELYGGYQARKIGKVSLHGPMVGLRAWF